MTHDDEVCLKLGREIVRMIHDVRKVTHGETGYARRTFTYPGGEVQLFLANDPKLADLFEQVASGEYNIQSVTPPSQRN